jgi:pimeloyl-ACP methyl ester carboxylesterase
LAPEAVEAASQAIDFVKNRVGAEKLHLVGYSGGGGLAALLAERRADVVTLVTVAGLLDTDWWVANGGWLPLASSLNPALQAASLIALPQIHFFGREDQVVTPDMARRFARLADFKNLSLVGLDTDHYRWTKLWPTLLEQVLKLRSSVRAAPAE